MEELNLYDLLRYYAKEWLTILTVVIIGTIIGIGYTYYIQQPKYESKATLLVVGTGRSSAGQESVVINNYVELFRSRRVLDPVIASNNYDKNYETLLANTKSNNVKNTDIINVSIATADSKKSKALLDDAIRTFSAESKKLYGNDSIKINVVDSPDAPDSPTNIKPLQQIGLAVVASLALAIVGLFFVYDYRKSNSASSNRTQDPETVSQKPKDSEKAEQKELFE